MQASMQETNAPSARTHRIAKFANHQPQHSQLARSLLLLSFHFTTQHLLPNIATATASMENSATSLSDYEKLQVAVGDVFHVFGGGPDSVLEAFGLADLPTAQRYGILFGSLVFVCTCLLYTSPSPRD